MDHSTPAHVVTLLANARRNGTRVPIATIGEHVRSADVAYRVQDAVARELGWFKDGPAVVWKAGATTRDAEPTAAPIPSMLVHTSPAKLSARSFHMIGIEAELAVRFGMDVGAEHAAAPGFDWSRAIDQMVVGIEVVDTRLDDFERAPPLVKLADFQNNGAYVIGSAVPFRRDFDWRSQRARLSRNGSVIADTRGGHSLDDPVLALLPWFVRHVESRGGRVRAGDMVTLGTWTGLTSAAAGDTIEAEFDGTGGVRVDFE